MKSNHGAYLNLSTHAMLLGHMKFLQPYKLKLKTQTRNILFNNNNHISTYMLHAGFICITFMKNIH